MAYDISQCLVIGISSRALFDLDEENRIFEEEGLEAYRAYQLEHEEDYLKPGSGFALVKALLSLNEKIGRRIVEVLIMSRNSADTSLRIFKSIEHYGLDISRAVLTGGAPLSEYLSCFKVDLFLSAHEGDVARSIQDGFAAGLIYTGFDAADTPKDDVIRIAFDGDAVLFSDEAEQIYQREGLEAFSIHEKENAKRNLPKGPFAKLLKTISDLQKEHADSAPLIRTALVTARNAPAHERVINTLRAWDVHIDEAFFLGGISKRDVLKAFGAQIFFDDQKTHIERACGVVPSAQVLYEITE